MLYAAKNERYYLWLRNIRVKKMQTTVIEQQ